MLTSIRKTSNTVFVKLLFVLLIASFAVWGIGDVLRTSQGDGPIEVGSRQISISAIDREFRGLLDEQSQALGFRLQPAQGIQFGLLDQAVSNLVSRALIDNLAAETGLRVSDETIRNFIRDQMGFRTAGGQFDRARFELDLRNRGMTEQLFVDQLRLDIARQDLLQTIVGGVRVPDVVAETLHAYREETRAAQYVRIDADSMPEPEAPTETALQTFYDSQVDAHMAPEYRSASVLLLDPDALASGVTVDEEQISEEFLYRRDSLFVPEERAIEQMILADGGQAEAAEAALADGRSFAEVAAEVAGQDPAALAMGSFSAAEWFLPDVADDLFSGEVGAVSAPVETPLGWRIYRVAAIEPSREPSLDEVRDSLADDIARRIAEDSLFDLAGQVQDEIAGGATLAEAADTLGMTLESVGPVSAQGLTPDGGEAAVPGGAAVLGPIFAEQPGVPSDQHDLPNGGIVFVEVGEVIPSARRPFDEVRDQVLVDWTGDRKQESARALAAEIEAEAGSAAPLSRLAEDRGLDLRLAEGVSRDGSETGGLTRDLAARLFELDPGEAISGEAEGEGIVYVAQLDRVIPAPDDPEAVRQLWLQVSEQATNDVFQALGDVMQTRFAPQVQQDMIRQTFLQSYGS
ncbi:MAG: SurA N-terminal domain-containing protein [Alphaproteobacteria bacterium]